MSQSPEPLESVESMAPRATTTEAYLPSPPLETRRARRERMMDLEEAADLDDNVIPISPYEERPQLRLVGSQRAMRRPQF